MTMRTTVVPALALAAVVAGGAFAVKAEPLLLTSSQMEAVTAGQVINTSPQITVNTGNVAVLQQLNVTNQVAVAVAVATAAGANAAATAANANLTVQSILQ
jgi:hypothetical protein